jgi:GntR family transcriptional repressor for pyruvate dehydrogenase complex
MAEASKGGKNDITVQLLSTFKQLISEGTLAPGARLPPEREISANLGVSRASLRQALKVLEIMGIISQRVGDGTYLNTGAPRVLSEPMEFLILLDGISFHELMEARLIVEPELAARAAIRASPADIAALRACILDMDKAARSDRDRLISDDLQFHDVISRAAGNRVCSSMFSVVHQQLANLIGMTSQLVELEHTLKLHKRIYAAIRKHDPDAARERMLEHLRDATSLLARANDLQAQVKLGDRISALSAAANRRQ